MEHIKPFKICGNTYFVGTKPASTHIIVTEEGIILIDPGLVHTSLPHVVENIWELGFDVRQIRRIVHSHGHYDHFGATRQLLELVPTAETFIGEPDYDYATGKIDLSLYREATGLPFTETFTPTHALHDGDVLSLGSTRIRCVSTPGHTPGTMSFFWDVVEDGRTYRCGMFGGAGMNTLKREFLVSHNLPFTARDDFQNSLNRLRREHVDVHVGNHCGNNDTLGRGARVAPGQQNPFIVPGDWEKHLDNCEKKLLATRAEG